MRRKHSAVGSDEAAAVRFAWWAAFFATLTLVAILGLAKSAQAVTVPAGGGEALSAPAFFPDDEPEGEAEASEDEGVEDEACEAGPEECEEEDDSGAAQAPEECLLSTADAAVFANANQDKIRLQVRYTTSTPTAVAVDYGLHGGKGSLYLGGERKHFSSHGVLRLTRNLTEAQMAKAMAARDFTVRLRVPAAPGYCQAFFDHQLDIRRATPSGLSWQQSE
jgi:hypothetical protein